MTGAPEQILTGMTERVADEETEEGSQPGVLREHEFHVEHAECEALGYLSTFVYVGLMLHSSEGQEKRYGRHLGEEAKGLLRLAKMTKEREGRR